MNFNTCIGTYNHHWFVKDTKMINLPHAILFIVTSSILISPGSFRSSLKKYMNKKVGNDCYITLTSLTY